MFHTSCDELVRKVGIYFDNKYLVLASPEKQHFKMSTQTFNLHVFYTAAKLKCLYLDHKINNI